VDHQLCLGRTAYGEMGVGRICPQQAVIRKRVSAWIYRIWVTHISVCLKHASQFPVIVNLTKSRNQSAFCL